MTLKAGRKGRDAAVVGARGQKGLRLHRREGEKSLWAEMERRKVEARICPQLLSGKSPRQVSKKDAVLRRKEGRGTAVSY